VRCPADFSTIGVFPGLCSVFYAVTNTLHRILSASKIGTRKQGKNGARGKETFEWRTAAAGLKPLRRRAPLGLGILSGNMEDEK